MIDKNILVKEILVRVMGELAVGSKLEDIAYSAYDMGEAYAHTKRFDNSRYYHNYQYVLDDGSKVSATNFYNIFMTRTQTPAYMEAEKIVKEIFAKCPATGSVSDPSDDIPASAPCGLTPAQEDYLFHFVREQRFGINGVFKAVYQKHEPQQLSIFDYILSIACFCAGILNNK